MTAISRPRPTTAGRALLRVLPTVAFAAVLLLAGTVWGTAPGPVGFLPDLGIFQIRLPAGTSYLTLPIAPVESMDVVDVLGPEILSAAAVESWDSAARSWQSYHPGRPGANAGQRRLAGLVVRLTLERPVTLSIRGTPASRDWHDQLAAGLDDEYFGASTEKTLTVQEVLDALESTGKFTRGRDPLQKWNLDAGRWDEAGSLPGTDAVPPGAVFRSQPAQKTKSAAPVAMGAQGSGQGSGPAGLPRQAEVPLDGARDPKGEAVNLSDYPQTTASPPDSPYTLSEYRYRSADGKVTAGIGRLTLPDSLLAMTDLPRTVPVRIGFTKEASPKAQTFEVLGVTRFSAGGQASHQPLQVSSAALALVIDGNGALFGKARTFLPARRGRGQASSDDVTLPAAPVSLFFTPSTTGAVIRTDGTTESRSGPLLDVQVAMGEQARAFRRWAPSSGLMPSGAAASEVVTGIWATTSFWLEHGPDLAKRLELASPSSWQDRSLAATLRSTDGQTVSSVDGSDVSTVKLRFSWLPVFAPSIPLAGVDNDKRTVASFYPTGLVEVAVSDRVSLQAWAGEFNFSFHDPAEAFEFGIMPTVTLEGTKAIRQVGANQAERADAMGAGLSLKLTPVFSFRAQNFAHTDAGYWEDLLLYVQPSLESKAMFDVMNPNPSGMANMARSLKSTFGGQPAGAGFSSLGSKITSEVSKGLKENFSIDAAGLAVGLASVARLEDLDNRGAHRLTLWGNGTWKWPRKEGKWAEQADYGLEGGGAYEDMNVGTEGGTPSPWALQVGFSKVYGDDGPTEVRSFRISGSYQLPPEWGWTEGRAASGQWTFTHEKLPDGTMTNRSVFRSLGLLSFRSKIDACDFFDVGNGDTAFTLDLTNFDVVLEAMQKGRVVTRTRTLAGAIWSGTTTASADAAAEQPADEAAAKGFLLSLNTSWKSTAPVNTTTPATAPFLSKLFPGPSVYGSNVAPRFDTMAELQFQNIGSDRFRMESLRGSWVTSGPRALTLSVGFRPPETDAWAEATGTIEKNAESWRFAADVSDVHVGSVCLQQAYLEFEKEPGRAWYDGLKLGGLVDWGPDSGKMDGSNLELGLDLDFGRRSGAVWGQLSGPIFCGGGDPDECPVKSGSLAGSVDFSSGWKSPEWGITAGCVFQPPWMEAGQTAKVLGRFTGKPVPSSFAFELQGGIPAATIPDNGKFQVTSLGLGFNRDTRVWSYSGSGRVTMPSSVHDVGQWLQLPRTVDVAMSGAGRRISLSSTLSPPLELKVLENLGLTIDTVRLSKASPWGVGLGAGLNADGKTVPCSATFDGLTQSFAFSVAPSVVVTISLGSNARVSISKFGLSVGRLPGTTGTPGHAGLSYRISGTASVEVDGKSYSGALAMTVDGQKNATLELKGADSSGLGALPEFAGMTVTAKGVGISSSYNSTSQKRTTGVTAAVGITLDEDTFGPLGGKELVGVVGVDAAGNVLLKVTTDFPEIRFPIPGTEFELPFSVALRSLQVKRNKTTKETSVSGHAVLSMLRPLNAILGASGDTPFVFDTNLGVEKDTGKTKVFFQCVFNPQMQLAFSLLGARGTLVLPGIKVTSEGDLNLALRLELTSPATSTLNAAAIINQGAVRFDITANPELRIDLYPAFILNFRRLAYKQAFPGFMGVAADIGFNVGFDVFGFGVDMQELMYVLPNSIPPFGFPFFEEVAANLRVFGFGAKASVSLPPPKIGLADALTLVSGFYKGLAKDQWTPLRDFLADRLQGDSAIFRGPGVGNLYLALPMVLREVVPEEQFPTVTWFPDDPDLRQQVVQLTLWAGMHYVTDIFPGQELADGLVKGLRIAAVVAKVFTDPVYIVNLIPEDHRAGGFSLNLAGILAAAASYACVVPCVYTNDGQAAAIPVFEELAEVSMWMDDPGRSSLPRIQDVIRGDAERRPPYPVRNQAFSFAAETGTTCSGVVDDQWIELRPFLQKTLDLTDTASPPGANIDDNAALVRHLKVMADEHQGAGQVGTQLVSSDHAVKVDLFGSSATVQVTAPGAKGILYKGSVPLGYTVTRTVEAGTLQLDSHLQLDGRQLISEVKGTLQSADGSSRQDLGSLSRTVLRNVDDPTFVAAPQNGRIVGWLVDHSLDTAKGMEAKFSDYGTFKFTGPNKEYTGVYPGAMLSDIRMVLSVLEPFRTTIYDYETSPYALGLKIWSKFLNDPTLKDRVDKITTDGRAVRITFREPTKNTTLELRLVLEDLAYYLTAERDPNDPEKIGSLAGATDIERFRFEGKRLLAEPFLVSFGEDRQEVRDLVVFDGGKEVQELLDRCEKQKTVLMETDLQQFSKMGLSVNGDPMIVKALRVELEVRQIRAIVRPKSILLTKSVDGQPLLDIKNGLVYTNLQTKGPYNDESNYPSEAGRYLTLSYQQTNSATTVFDLHEALGSNVLYRTVTVQAPGRLAGAYTEMAPGQLQGMLPAPGGPYRVTAGNTGMQVTVDATPAPLTLYRTLGGTLSGKVPFNGADRAIEFYFDDSSGGRLAKYKYPTGKVEPGGFMTNAGFSLDLAVMALSMTISGELKAGGYYRFVGDINLSLLGRLVRNAHYELSSTEGLYITGGMDMFIGDAMIEGRLHAKKGASALGTLRVLPGGTGIDARASVDTNASEKLKLRGAIKVANHTIATQNISLDGNRFKTGWSVGGKWAGVSSDLTFRYSGGFGIDAKGRAWLKILFGTIRVGIGFSVSSSGRVSLCVGPLEISINIGKMDFDIDLC
ncbi:MAG: hypothetical protein HY814_06810 [Candidatus Riflebacteria bacterium]|nr:hypothetical protein [Candidatus Riflebacteria bacterium]